MDFHHRRKISEVNPAPPLAGTDMDLAIAKIAPDSFPYDTEEDCQDMEVNGDSIRTWGIGIVSLSNLTYGAMGMPNFKALDTLITLATLKPRTLPASAILEQRKKKKFSYSCPHGRKTS